MLMDSSTSFSYNLKIIVKLQTKDTNQPFKVLGGFDITRASISVIGSLLFSIYLNELIIILKYVGICNFTDDAPTKGCDENLENILKLFKKNCKCVLKN